MIIGVPKEIKENEYRVALTPPGVEALVSRGHEVVMETNAGSGIGISDNAYKDVGANIVPESHKVYERGEMVLKVKEIFPVEYDLLRERQIIFTYLHSANNPEETQALLDKKVIAIAYEDIETDDGEMPLLTPMSEIAGEVGLIMGAYHMFTINGGSGLLIGGAAGVEPVKVAILGAGRVGLGAARYALGLGADVTIMDIDLDRLREVRQKIFPRAKTVFLNNHNIRNLLPDVDMLINAVKWPPRANRHIVTRDMLKIMKKSILVVDISCDPAGAIETCVPTSHDKPTYEVEGIRHFCVDNLPSAVARTSSYSLCNATLPYVMEIAEKGWLEAIKGNTSLRRGLGFASGYLTFKPTADVQNREYTPPEVIIEMYDK
ncbi:MAG: alanine dehydrogenase [Desulfobacteraceae bacterium 4484_190.2]|nr:MAG: alanine dehydrogenase [Desulfobacteraceae bacterium 4484_190.2]